jgi:hypothetical protein
VAQPPVRAAAAAKKRAASKPADDASSASASSSEEEKVGLTLVRLVDAMLQESDFGSEGENAASNEESEEESAASSGSEDSDDRPKRKAPRRPPAKKGGGTCIRRYAWLPLTALLDARGSARAPRKSAASRETMELIRAEELGLRKRNPPSASNGAQKKEPAEGLRRVGLGLRARNKTVQYNDKEEPSEPEDEDEEAASSRRKLPAPKKEQRPPPVQRSTIALPDTGIGLTRLVRDQACGKGQVQGSELRRGGRVIAGRARARQRGGLWRRVVSRRAQW